MFSDVERACMLHHILKDVRFRCFYKQHGAALLNKI